MIVRVHRAGFAASLGDVEFEYQTLGRAASSHDPSAFCAKLGSILLEIFSRGKSSSLLKDSSCNNQEVADADEPESIDDDYCPLQAMAKRMALVAIGDSASDKVKKFLADLGVPLSVGRLVSDLLTAADDTERPVAAITLEDALRDLSQMRSNPSSFLFDRTCPQKALDDTRLFINADTPLFGRENELGALREAKGRISSSDPTGGRSSEFLCEMAFLRGNPGSGKSRLTQELIRACDEDRWFVLGCKFDKQSPPHDALARAFDDFFAQWGPGGDGDPRPDCDPGMLRSFHDACGFTFSAIDSDGFDRLCELVPNFTAAFPLLAPRRAGAGGGGISSLDTVGYGDRHRLHLFCILLKSLCSSGRPVLFTLDDLQDGASDPLVLELLAEFPNYMNDRSVGRSVTCQQRLLVLATYRSNEISDSHENVIDSIPNSGLANVQKYDVAELSEKDINELISAKLGLPMRYTKRLAELVHNKTGKGNPFHVIQFLRSIIQNKLLEFSVRARQWVWDDETVEMMSVTEGVAELLTTTFSKLPPPLMQTLQMLSCLGYQVDESTIQALNGGHIIHSCDMVPHLRLAVEECILEKAGPLYQFTHDLVQQTIYESIPPPERTKLHKSIGDYLLASQAKSQTIQLCAVNQINTYCEDGGGPTGEEDLPRYAQANADAAKLVSASSSFDQARKYAQAGMRLLKRCSQHWTHHYPLSLQLHDLSASLACKNGDSTTMSIFVDEILSHAKQTNDKLNAVALKGKLLASQSRYEEARLCLIEILSELDEHIPQDVSQRGVAEALSSMRPTLDTLSADQVKSLPRLNDPKKLHVMKFLSMLCKHSDLTYLLPPLTLRMMNITFESGFCEESIIGFIQCAHAMFIFTEELSVEDMRLTYKVTKVCEALIPGESKSQQLSLELENYSMKARLIEPIQAALAKYPGLYESAMLAGDIGGACELGWNFCLANFFTGEMNLASLAEHCESCLRQQKKYMQANFMHFSMPVVRCMMYLSNITIDGVKTFEELRAIGECANDRVLLFQVFMAQLSQYFWMNDYVAFITLSARHPLSKAKRVLDMVRCFYEGIASLSLARDTHEQKYQRAGEACLKLMVKLETLSEWNFGSKRLLLQAELHYLNGEIELADDSYNSSIAAARRSRFFNEEALAYELYGTFLVECNMPEKGLAQLQMAVEKYGEWGAKKKLDWLQTFIASVNACRF